MGPYCGRHLLLVQYSTLRNRRHSANQVVGEVGLNDFKKKKPENCDFLADTAILITFKIFFKSYFSGQQYLQSSHKLK